MGHLQTGHVLPLNNCFTFSGEKKEIHLSTKNFHFLSLNGQIFPWVKFISVAQSCVTLCDPMNCSTPGLPVIINSWSSLRLTSIELVMSSRHLILCQPCLLLPPIPPSIRAFPITQHFAWGGQSTGVSDLSLFLPMNTQDLSPLEWTGWISLQSKELSRVISNTKVQTINSSALRFLHSPTLTIIHDHWKNRRLD